MSAAPSLAATPANIAHLQAFIAQQAKALAQFDAPAAPAGQQEFSYQHGELGMLECHLDYDHESGHTELTAAYLHGTDVSAHLSSTEVQHAESAAARHFDAQASRPLREKLAELEI